MTQPRVAHVVRDYGGLTEPFIARRIQVGAPSAELWTERSRAASDIPERHIAVRLIRAGTAGDRAFHRLPMIGPPLAGPYAAQERATRPDVIHAHYLTTGYLVGSRTRAPLVVSVYGFDATLIPRRPGWREAIRALTSRAAGFVAEGPFMAATLRDLGADPAAIHVVPIAAGLEGIAFRPRPAPRGAVRLLACGRFVEKKGLDLAIEAFARARAELPEGSTLEIVGGGPLEGNLKRLVARLDVEGHVRFLGPLRRPDYLEVLAVADLLLAPSRTASNGDSEGGAPTTILDAQAAGVPVVGSSHADIPFLVADGVTGYLVAEADVEVLKEGILRAFGDSASWATITANARGQVVARHADGVVAARIADIHEQVATQ